MKTVFRAILICIALTLLAACTPLNSGSQPSASPVVGARHAKDGTVLHTITFKAEAIKDGKSYWVPIDVILNIQDEDRGGGRHAIGVISRLNNTQTTNPFHFLNKVTPWTHELVYAQDVDAIVTFTTNYHIHGQSGENRVRCEIFVDGISFMVDERPVQNTAKVLTAITTCTVHTNVV